MNESCALLPPDFLCMLFPLPRICATWLTMIHYLHFSRKPCQLTLLGFFGSRCPIGLLEFQPPSAPWWFQLPLTRGHSRKMAALCCIDNTHIFQGQILFDLDITQQTEHNLPCLWDGVPQLVPQLLSSKSLIRYKFFLFFFFFWFAISSFCNSKTLCSC